MIVWARHSDRTGERTWHVVSACVLAATGMVLAGLSTTVVTVVLALIVTNVGVSSAKPPLWTMPTMFLSGPEAAAGLATINSVGNLGGFAGLAMTGWTGTRPAASSAGSASSRAA
jgi:ACS family tartrate transporter-like MFS transporter